MSEFTIRQLTDEKVAEIKWFLENGVQPKLIAKMLRVKQSTVSRIASGKLWNEIKAERPGKSWEETQMAQLSEEKLRFLQMSAKMCVQEGHPEWLLSLRAEDLLALVTCYVDMQFLADEAGEEISENEKELEPN